MSLLEKHEAHVWWANLNYPAAELANFFNVLAEDEKQRAERFHFLKDKNHFIIARGLLRKILSQYLAISPQDLQFQYTSYGKPTLKDYPDLQFNVSHSHGVALYAITREQAVGVDIEFTQRNCDIDAIAERYFSAEECRVIKNLTGSEKNQAFFNGWARKEAFLKALGEGLSYPLNQVEVTLMAGQPAAFVALHDKNLNINDWCLRALEVISGYAAALAVKGDLRRVVVMEFT
jgi:4'-phosphopantetheinyl transferase